MSDIANYLVEMTPKHLHNSCRQSVFSEAGVRNRLILVWSAEIALECCDLPQVPSTIKACFPGEGLQLTFPAHSEGDKGAILHTKFNSYIIRGIISHQTFYTVGHIFNYVELVFLVPYLTLM